MKIQIYAIGQFSIVVNGQTLKNTQTSHLVTLSIEDNKDKGIISMVGSKFHDFYVDQKCPPTWIVCDQMCVSAMLCISFEKNVDTRLLCTGTLLSTQYCTVFICFL